MHLRFFPFYVMDCKLACDKINSRRETQKVCCTFFTQGIGLNFFIPNGCGGVFLHPTQLYDSPVCVGFVNALHIGYRGWGDSGDTICILQFVSN